MDKRKYILSVVSVIAAGIFCGGMTDNVNAKATNSEVAKTAQRNFVNEPKEDDRVAIVMYVKDEIKDGVVYETERPVRVFQYRVQAERYIKEHEEVHQYKRGLYAGELRIRESKLWR